MAQRFKEKYGDYATERGWDNPDRKLNRYFYWGVVIFLGLFLLVMSFHEFFGPISL